MSNDDMFDHLEKILGEKLDEVLRQHSAVPGRAARIGSTPKSNSKPSAIWKLWEVDP